MVIRPGRLEAFSDGVFAIAITLLVLEISIPGGNGEDLLDGFLDQWPSYLAYLVSFATIGVSWLRHAVITHHLRGVDTIFIRLNLLLLLFVGFLPVPTALVAEHLRDDQAERVAVTILGINLLLVSVLLSVMWRYALGHGLVEEGPTDAELQLLTQRITPGLVSYVAFLVIGLFLPIVAVVGYLVIAIVLLLPAGLREPPEPDPGLP
jgi:uncharacterized membrane protein